MPQHSNSTKNILILYIFLTFFYEWRGKLYQMWIVLDISSKIIHPYSEISSSSSITISCICSFLSWFGDEIVWIYSHFVTWVLGYFSEEFSRNFYILVFEVFRKQTLEWPYKNSRIFEKNSWISVSFPEDG